MSQESHGFSCHSSEPSEEAQKPQPWPAIFTFPSRGRGWLEQISSSRELGTHFYRVKWSLIKCLKLLTNIDILKLL